MRHEVSRDWLRELIWDSVRNSDYPSPPMLDRAEAIVCSRADGEAYLDILWEKVQGEYPSLQILARIERVTHALALAEMIEEQTASTG